MKVLVTGACGFVGKNLVPYLRERHFDVYTLDMLPECKEIEGRGRHLQYNLGDYAISLAGFQDLENVEIIIHLAAQSHVDRSISDPVRFFKDNELGTIELLDMCVKSRPNYVFKNLKKFILFSTDEVVANLKEGEGFFDSPFKCGSTYSATKAAQELHATAYMNTFDLPVYITRCVNIFGPHQADEKFIPTVIRNAVNDQPVPIYGNGYQERQWVHVNHVCEFLNEYLLFAAIPPGNIAHICGTKEFPNRLIATMILGLLGKDSNLITTIADRLGHDIRYALGRNDDDDHFDLPRYRDSFVEDMIETVKWYSDKYEGIKNGKV